MLALDEQSEVLQRGTGLTHSDGSRLMHSVNQNVKKALGRYLQAQKNISDHVLNRFHLDQSRMTAVPSSEQPRATSVAVVEVLLIEDNVPEARLIETIATHGSAPVRITTAHDCSGALARLSDPHIKPNLVIADMGVLEFGGVELMKRCKPRSIPVVIFTGSENPLDAAHALELGAKEFVVKPTELDAYADAVWRMISKWTVPQA